MADTAQPAEPLKLPTQTKALVFGIVVLMIAAIIGQVVSTDGSIKKW